MKKVFFLFTFVLTFTMQAQLYLSEIFISPPENDQSNEYIEVRGEPNATIANGTYIVTVDGDFETTGNGPGDLESDIIDLSGLQLGSNGYLVVLGAGSPYTTLVDTDGTITVQTDGNIEDQSHTILLIQTDTPPSGSDDIDINNDGEPDGVYLTWNILDSISFADDDADGVTMGNNEYAYGQVIFAEAAIIPNLLHPTGATIVSTTTQYDYAARLGNSTGYSVTNDPTTSDWVGSDIPGGGADIDGNAINLPNWFLTTSSTAGRIIPDAMRGELLNHIGGENFPNVWTGTTSNDWSTDTNWSKGTAPVAYEYIEIPSGLTNYPNISVATTVAAINIESGASLIATAAVTSDVTYTRNLPTNNWYLIASPVSGESVFDFANAHTLETGSGVSPSQNIALGTYANDGSAWNYYLDGDVDGINGDDTTDMLTAGVGYTTKLQAAGDISFKGTINTTASYALTQGATNDFNLVGNPYTAFLSSGSLLGANTSSLTQSIWTWNAAMGTYDVAVQADDFKVAPGQGFFVEALSAGSVSVSTAMLSHETSDTFKRNVRPEIQLYVSSNDKERYAKIYYYDVATTGFDNGYEGKVFGGVSDDFQVYTHLIADNIGEKYQVQSLPTNELENLIIPIGLTAEAGKEITFSTNTLNLPIDTNIYLEDRINNSFVNLSKGDYKTTLQNAINGVGKFYIHASAKSLSTEDIVANNDNVSIYASTNNQVTIAGLQDVAKVEVFSILGKKITNSEIYSDGVSIIELPDVSSGVYLVKLNSASVNMTKKVILK